MESEALDISKIAARATIRVAEAEVFSSALNAALQHRLDSPTKFAGTAVRMFQKTGEPMPDTD